MRTETINIYTIDEHPNKEACFEWIRNNWHDLGDFTLELMTDSLNALAYEIGGNLDYSLSIVPDRGEFVKITGDREESLKSLYEKRDSCPLTGCCYDVDVIEGLFNDELESTVLDTLHKEGDYIYSDEGLLNLCQANEYEFTENGELA